MNSKPVLSNQLIRKTLHSRNTALHGEVLTRPDRTRVALLDIVKSFQQELRTIVKSDFQESRVDLDLRTQTVVVFNVDHKPEFKLTKASSVSWTDAAPIFDLVVSTVAKIFTAVESLQPYLSGVQKDPALLANFRIASGVTIDGLKELFVWYCLINDSKYRNRILTLIELEKFDYMGLFVAAKYARKIDVQFLANNKGGNPRLGEKFSYTFIIDGVEFDMTTYISLRPARTPSAVDRVLVVAPAYESHVVVNGCHSFAEVNSSVDSTPEMSLPRSLSMSAHSTPVPTKRRSLTDSELFTGSSVHELEASSSVLSPANLALAHCDESWIHEACIALEPTILDNITDVQKFQRWLSRNMTSCRSAFPEFQGDEVELKLKTLCVAAQVPYPLSDSNLLSVKQFVISKYQDICAAHI